MARLRLLGKRRRGAPPDTKYFQGRSGNVVRRKRRIGRKSKPVFQPALRNTVYRWQRTSDSFMGPGAQKLMAYPNAPGNIRYLPIQFISLTNNSQGVPHPGKGCDLGGMRQVYYEPVGGSFGYTNLQCQNASNATLNTTWQFEKGEAGPSVIPDLARYMRHRWTDIKMNLYGTFSVPITYDIYLLTCKQQLDPLNYAAALGINQGSELHNMFKDITRDLVGNSVSKNGRIDWPRDVRILRHDRVSLQPLNYSDQVAELSGPVEVNNAHTPNVHEYRMFVNHNRYRDYKWSENASDETYNNDLSKPQWDVNVAQDVMCDVEWGKRVYLFITATHPGPNYAQASDSSVPDANDVRIGGSYDICIRNSFDYQW